MSPPIKNDFERSPASRALDQVVSEAKVDLDVAEDRDWSAVEKKLFARVEKEKPTLVADHARPNHAWESNALRLVAFGLAVAASVALFVHRDRDAALGEAPAARTESASSLRTTEGAGEVRVQGVLATAGYSVHSGDTIVVEGARAVFERPRKVTWLLEALNTPANARATEPAKARIKASADPLIVGLVDGAIEAQVAPVPTGEAFAVDIATGSNIVRVAVHGTHLRVQRNGDRVVVDLTEGVVSIGHPPRTGTTYGTLVNAPAHVELDANDLSTLKVDHNPSAVRPAISLGTHEAVAGHDAPGHVDAPPAAAPAPPSPAFVPKAKAAEAARGDAPKQTLAPRDAIATAIRDCAAANRQKDQNNNVQVTVTSTLRLQVSAAGLVESAQFSPPLLPEIQTCAAQTIYKTKLDETGAVAIPVEFSF